MMKVNDFLCQDFIPADVSVVLEFRLAVKHFSTISQVGAYVDADVEYFAFDVLSMSVHFSLPYRDPYECLCALDSLLGGVDHA